MTIRKKTLQPNAIPQDLLMRQITNLVPALIAVYNIHTGKYTYINDSISKILGYRKEDWLKKDASYVASFVHPDDIPIIMSQNQKALQKANSKSYKNRGFDPIVTFEYRLKHKKGNWVWLKTDGVVFDRDAIGRVEHVMNISIDITERKNREEKLRSKEKETQDELFAQRDQLEIILKNIADGVTVQDLKGKLIYANMTAAKASGYKSPEQLLSAPIGDVLKRFDITKENGDPIPLEEFPGRRAIAGEESPKAVFRYLNRKTKEIRWSIVRANIIKRDGKPAFIVNTIQDITERKLIELEQSRLAAIVESSDDAIISKNLDGIIASWNKGAERIFGYKNEEAIGKHITLIIPTTLRDEERRIIDNIKRGERIEHYETVRVKKSGEKVRLSLSISPIKDQDGTIIGASKIARDITKQKELERQKDDFLGIASHELKTPVTSIKSFAQVLKLRFERAGNQSAVDILGKLDTQVDKLRNLIGDLLDVTKIESGKMQFNAKPFPFDDLVSEITEELQWTTENHKLILKGKTGKKIHADRERIGQVLTNLLSNAIKYSPRSKDIIVVSSVENSNVKVCVQDFGMGIAKNKHEKVFERFFRVSGPEKDTYPGLGLGLYISSEIIRRSGGRIWVESVEKKGSRFCFTLPTKTQLGKN